MCEEARGPTDRRDATATVKRIVCKAHQNLNALRGGRSDGVAGSPIPNTSAHLVGLRRRSAGAYWGEAHAVGGALTSANPRGREEKTVEGLSIWGKIRPACRFTKGIAGARLGLSKRSGVRLGKILYWDTEDPEGPLRPNSDPFLHCGAGWGVMARIGFRYHLWGSRIFLVRRLPRADRHCVSYLERRSDRALWGPRTGRASFWAPLAWRQTRPDGTYGRLLRTHAATLRKR